MRKTRQHPGDGGEIWPDDAELQPVVSTAQQGEPGAVNALLARLRPLFVKFFSRQLDRDTAEDLAQDALLRVVGALPRIDPARASRYVTRVAHRRLKSESQRRARDAQRFAPIEVALAIPSPVRADQADEYADLVRAAAKLSPRVRACVLGALHGLRAVETAVAQGVSPVTVRVQLKDARARLRSALGLAPKEPHKSLGVNHAPPPQVREGTPRLPYSTKRFPEWRSRGSRRGEFALRARLGLRSSRAPRPWRRRARATSS